MENENYLSIESLDPNQVVIYERCLDDDNDPSTLRLYRKVCLLTANKNRYHKYCGFNKFTIETYPLPSTNDNWINMFETEDRDDNLKEWYDTKLKYRICDPNGKVFCPQTDHINKPENCTMYKTLDNYDIGFLVLINNNTSDVYVYGKTDHVLTSDLYECDKCNKCHKCNKCDGDDGDVDDSDDVVDDNACEKCNYDETVIFTKKIITYTPLEIFIGKSTQNKMTDFSGGHGDKFDGNSILLRIGSQNEYRYVFIGSEIYEFNTDEKITTYISSVGNNCVPYPYAVSENFCYCMLEHSKTPVAQHLNRETRGYISYEEDATYVKMDTVTIWERDSYNAKHEYPHTEKTNMVRFKSTEPMQMKLISNSCVDETLPAVQHLNEILGSK